MSLQIIDGKRFQFRDRDLWMLAEIETHPKVTKWNIYAQTDDLNKMHGVFEESLKALPNKEDQIFLIARLDDTVAGFLGIQCRKEGVDHVGNLGLSVHPNYWRKGIGTRLLQTAVKHARKHKLSKLEAETLATNKPMLRITEKAGFKSRAQRKLGQRGNTKTKFFLR